MPQMHGRFCHMADGAVGVVGVMVAVPTVLAAALAMHQAGGGSSPWAFGCFGQIYEAPHFHN